MYLLFVSHMRLLLVLAPPTPPSKQRSGSRSDFAHNSSFCSRTCFSRSALHRSMRSAFFGAGLAGVSTLPAGRAAATSSGPRMMLPFAGELQPFCFVFDGGTVVQVVSPCFGAEKR